MGVSSTEAGFPEPRRQGVPRRARREPGRGGRHRLRWALSVVLVLLLLAGAAGFYVYRQLNGNIQQAPLFSGTKGNAGTEKPDPFGRVPINLLIIGSDSRSSASDCHLGGDCNSGPGQNADVEMVVHVSADRTNATVMSVPRDTVTELPACTDSKTGARVGQRYAQINSTLTYGPGCTVAAVHALTGIPIDHFVMVDFSGVISMSDSVGGVSVCVTNNVFDPYSHLKLARGTHTLKGLAALEFVRSRHAFGDGSDLGRTYAQHVFLSAVIRSLKRKGVLLNPAAVYSLAQAATKALTVDPALSSIPKLLGLATDVNKVPTDRVTFTTMQTSPDPTNVNRVVVAAGAQSLFATIINDQSLTKPPASTGSTGAKATPSPTASVDIANVVVDVKNGSGTAGRAGDVVAALKAKGFSPQSAAATAAGAVTTSKVEYGPGELASAQAVAKALKLPTSGLTSVASRGVTVLIGSDWTTGSTFGKSGSQAAQRRSALAQAHAQTAKASSCVPVSTDRTVAVNGIPMTPIQAFAATPSVPVSAK